MPDPTVATLRVLGWMLGVAMVVDFALSMLAFGEASGLLPLGGIGLLAGLAWTSPRIQSWLEEQRGR